MKDLAKQSPWIVLPSLTGEISKASDEARRKPVGSRAERSTPSSCVVIPVKSPWAGPTPTPLDGEVRDNSGAHGARCLLYRNLHVLQHLQPYSSSCRGPQLDRQRSAPSEACSHVNISTLHGTGILTCVRVVSGLILYNCYMSRPIECLGIVTFACGELGRQ